MNHEKKMKQWKQFLSWLLIFCVFFTSCGWEEVAEAAGMQKDTGDQTEESTIQEELEDSIVYEEPEDIKKEELTEERTTHSTTWLLSDGNKQTVFYSNSIRYEDENGELTDYDSSLVAVSEEKSTDGADLEGYAYENAKGDKKSYIPEKIDDKTPLRLENGEYSLEVTPLFGVKDSISDESGIIKNSENISEMAESGMESDSAKMEIQPDDDSADLALLSDEDNGFGELSSIDTVDTKQENVTDLYGNEEEKTTTAVYSASDETFKLEYIPYESGVKENLILLDKPQTNVWQFAFTLGGGLTARKNAANEGISFYAVEENQEEVLAGGIQVPFMNDATGEHYNENITYDLEPVSGQEGSYILTMTIDQSYLDDSKTVYPVTIDPSYTWTGGSAIYDVYVLSGSSYADLNFYDSSTTGMFAGRTNANGYERTYISFNGLANKIKGYSVASAKLTVYETGGGTAGETVQAYTVKEAWDKSTITWKNRPGYSTLLSSFTNTAKANSAGTFDITSYARKVANGTSDYGIMLRTKAEAVSKYAKFYGSRHSSAAYRPKLTVTYIDKPAEASNVSVEKYWLKKDVAAKVNWKGITSSALKSIQYRVALLSDDGKEFVNTEYAPYASNPIIGNTASGTASIDTTSLGEGCFRVYVRGVDKYGSTGPGKGASFVVDGTAPTLSSANVSPSTSATVYSNNATPTIKWSGAADRWLNKVQYSINGSVFKIMGTDPSGSFTVPEGKITDTGKYTIKVRSADKSSNVSTAKTLYYYYDGTKPTGKISVTDDGSNAGKYKINLTASDAVSGVKSVVLKLSGDSLSSAVTLYSGTAASSVNFDPASYPEGTYTLTLTVTDKAGNVFSTKKNFRPIVISEWTPDNLTVQDKINYKTMLKWDRRVEDEIPDGISYEIYRSTVKGFTPNSSTLAASGIRAFYWCEPNVDYGSTYYYKVRAVRTNSSGTVIASSDFSKEVSSTVISADEYNKRLGIKDYWGYQSFDNPVGNGQVEESKGNFVYQQEDISLPSSELEFGITRTYNSQSTAKTAFGNGWDHNFNLEILRVCASNGQETDSYVYKDGSGTIEHLSKQSDGSYVSGSTKELHLYESTETEGEILELENGPEISWTYRMEDKGQTNWYFNNSGQAVAITDPAGTWMVLHYDEKQGMLSQVEASTGKVLEFTYQDADQGDHLLVKTITLPDRSTLNYAYNGLYLISMTRKSADGSQNVVYKYSWEAKKVSTIYDAENNAYGLAYDSSGRVQALTFPDGEKTVLSYDNVNKKTIITKKTSSGGTILTETMSWNDSGNIVSYVDALGRKSIYTYENNCLVSTSTEAEWETVENGKVVFHTGTKTSRTDYDSLGNVKKDTDENGNVTSYTYGDSGNPNLVTKEVTTNNGTLITDTRYTYDNVGRITEKKDVVVDTVAIYVYTDNPEQNADGYQISVTEKEDNQKVSSSNEVYDAEGNLLTEENEAGGIQISSENSYDAMGNLLESNSSDGSKTIYTYDFMGRLIKQQDYDKEGNLAQTQETSYYPNGQVKSETAADGRVTAYTYDSRNRVISTKITAGGNSRTSSTSYGYGNVAVKNGQGNNTVTIKNAAKVTETDAAGSESVTWMDGCKQTIRITENGLNNDTLYDGSGQGYANIISPISNGNVTSVTLSIFDQDGNQTDTVLQPEYTGGAFTVVDSSIRTTQSYDVKGNVIRATDELGNETQYTYDDSGQLLSVKEGNETTSYQYNTEANGNSKTVTTRANGSTSTTVEDGAGRTLYIQDNGSGKEIKTSYEYDEEGVLTKQIQTDNSYLGYEYDSQGRLAAASSYDSGGKKQHSTEYTYDEANRVTSMVDYEGENGKLSPLRYTGYSYNSFGELAESWEVDGTDKPSASQKSAHLITYAYNADGSCASVSYADNGNGITKLSYTYNAQKQLTKITANLKDGRTRTLSEYSYTTDGKVASRKDYEDFAGTGSRYVQRHYTYDAFDRVLTMSYNESGNTGKTEESHSYQYDKGSHIIHEETSLDWNGQSAAASEIKDYTYDNKGQLIKSILVDQNHVRTTTEYSYDTVGNRLKMTETLFAQKEKRQLKKEETVNTYNSLDQLLTSSIKETTGTSSAVNTSSVAYTYDVNGNLVSTVDSVKKEETTYQYNPHGQMVSYQAKKNGSTVLNQTNAYNGEGQRISREEGNAETAYFYQNGTLLMSEDGDGNLENFYYLGASGNPLATMSKSSDGTQNYYVYQKDVQGSTQAITSNNGSCVEWYTYTDFGETTVHEEQNGFDTVICYTGGVYDENTGLYYLNARYYDPETGRFLSRDTYRGEADKPDTLHLYLYCANDPVNYVDPSGHAAKIAVIYYTGYKKGKNNEYNGLRMQAYLSLYYDSNSSNVKFYSIKYASEFYDIWNKIKKTKASNLYIYTHGGSGTLYFYKSSISYKELKENLKKNTKLKKIYLLSCKGAKGGKNSIAYALWKKTKAKVYASKEKVSFDVINDGIRTYYAPRYSGKYILKHPSYMFKNPIQLQKYK